MNGVMLSIKRMNDKAIIPSLGSSESAGLDLTATSMKIDFERGLVKYGTGISIQMKPINKGDVYVGNYPKYVAELYPRSSVIKKDLMMWNSVGIIDQDYRGEISVAFKYLGNIEDLKDIENANIYSLGERVGQLVIKEIPQVAITEVKELDETDRGSGGFGSTGK